MIFVFWFACFIVFYHLFGYGILLSIIARMRKENIKKILKEYPSITVLCPAYNEEEKIEEKIISFLNINYPKDKIKMIVISDDSTDNTNEIVKKYINKNIELVIQKPRKGKPSGHNLVEPSINSDYVLSTDGNSLFEPNSVIELVKIIISDKKIGIVSGALKLKIKGYDDSGEGLYWKYESYIKELESSYHSILGSNGSIFLIKRELFSQIHPASVDDFERTLQVLKNKYLARYASRAIVFEEVTENPIEELKRKVRIISREWFALQRNITLLNPFKHSKIFWMMISHKLIRWLFFLWFTIIFVSNIFLVNHSRVFMILFVLQVIGYLAGFVEIILEKNGKSNKLLKLPAYFMIMYYASLMGFVRFVRGKQVTTWNTIREDN